MTLNEFVNHIKHNSLTLNIECRHKEVPDYIGTIGTYKHSAFKSSFGSIEVSRIYPAYKEDDILYVTLDEYFATKYIEDHRKEKEVIK